MTKLFPVILAAMTVVNFGFSCDARGDSDWTSVRQVSYSQISAAHPSPGSFVTQGAKGGRLRWGAGGTAPAPVEPSYGSSHRSGVVPFSGDMSTRESRVTRSSVVPTQFTRDQDAVAQVINNGNPIDGLSLPVVGGVSGFSLQRPDASTIPTTPELSVAGENPAASSVPENDFAPPIPGVAPTEDWMNPATGTAPGEIEELQLPGQSPEEIERGVRSIIDPQGTELFTSDPCNGRAAFTPIAEITYDISQEPGGAPTYCALEGSDHYMQPRQWCELTFTWKASGMCHKPLYFADEHLERYGHSWGPLLQPIISTGRFWAAIPILPYKMGVHTPGECIYTLGHYRPGSCTPYMIDPLPLSVRGALFEAGAIVGGVLAIP